MTRTTIFARPDRVQLLRRTKIPPNFRCSIVQLPLMAWVKYALRQTVQDKATVQLKEPTYLHKATGSVSSANLVTVIAFFLGRLFLTIELNSLTGSGPPN